MLTMRAVSASDADLICEHRARMFRAMGTEEVLVERMEPNFRAWLVGQLGMDGYSGFIVEDGPRAVASIGFQILGWPPHPLHPRSCIRGYILNLFVEPSHQEQGVGTSLMHAAEEELARRGAEYAFLHAAPEAASLYGKLGWASTTEMAKRLEIDITKAPTPRDE